ncbi:MAG: leucine--tRNA ligase [Planctomycetes bacterium]|nr:leucine--tRNA ligase [Planctomycetota bacterium]
MPYDPHSIEPKWQQRWLAEKTFSVKVDRSRPKYYVLDMFPYPSGAGLHVGHPKGYTATDVVSRWKRMQGFNVLHPMGWDAFGLPAERAAVRENLHPAVITRRNVENFRKQIQRLGFAYDWERELSTTDVEYYKWTQWIFLKLFEKGLAYQAEVAVNWCPALGTVLANEEVVDGKYVETGDPVEKRSMRQWMMKITAYAERLITDLDGLDWPESLKEMQRHWIGKSSGAEVTFAVAGGGAATFTVFTTRPDTLFGATWCVLAPEHPLVAQITAPAQRAAVDAYVAAAKNKAERDRMADTKEKTGAFTGAFAVNPATGQPIPIWVADYVLWGYGTGAIMAVPGHDERDHAFAKTFGLPIVQVVKRAGASGAAAGADAAAPIDVQQAAFVDDGVAVNSRFLDGKPTADAKAAMTKWLEEKGLGKERVQYKLRDWLFSRQRYWGEPFPVLHRADGTTVAVPDDQLPVLLPPIDEYKPTADGQPPLARATDWVKTTDPRTGQPATRETNTMPQWAGSCWYYLRFIDPKNAAAPWSKEAESYWMPVDLYVGGVEHAVLHLLYARFWHKVLYDLGLVTTMEPFQKLRNQGMIVAASFQEASGKYHYPQDVEETAPGSGQWRVKATGVAVRTQIEKMSKSRYNVVNPDDVVRDYGADSMRLYECFIGPMEAGGVWQTNGVEGVYRFLERAWRLFFTTPKGATRDVPNPALVERPLDPDPKAGEKELEKLLHKTIQKVTADLAVMGFNTAISALMVYVNALTGRESLPKALLDPFARLLAPFAPHLAEEAWASALGHATLIADAPWPQFDPALCVDDELEIAVQVNGKVRDTIKIPAAADAAQCQRLALASEKVQRAMEGKPARKVIVVPKKIVNVIC